MFANIIKIALYLRRINLNTKKAMVDKFREHVVVRVIRIEF